MATEVEGAVILLEANNWSVRLTSNRVIEVCFNNESDDCLLDDCSGVLKPMLSDELVIARLETSEDWRDSK